MRGPGVVAMPIYIEVYIATQSFGMKGNRQESASQAAAAPRTALSQSLVLAPKAAAGSPRLRRCISSGRLREMGAFVELRQHLRVSALLSLAFVVAAAPSHAQRGGGGGFGAY